MESSKSNQHTIKVSNESSLARSVVNEPPKKKSRGSSKTAKYQGHHCTTTTRTSPHAHHSQNGIDPRYLKSNFGENPGDLNALDDLIDKYGLNDDRPADDHHSFYIAGGSDTEESAKDSDRNDADDDHNLFSSMNIEEPVVLEQKTSKQVSKKSKKSICSLHSIPKNWTDGSSKGVALLDHVLTFFENNPSEGKGSAFVKMVKTIFTVGPLKG